MSLLFLLLLLTAAAADAAAVDVKIAILHDQQQQQHLQPLLEFVKLQLAPQFTGLNASFVTRQLLSNDSLQLVVNDLCSWLPVQAVADFSGTAQTRCIAQSLAQQLDVAYISGAAPTQEATSCVGTAQPTLQFPADSFISSVAPFAAATNFTIAAAAVLYDATWDARSLVPTNGFPTELYLFQLPSNQSALPEFLSSVRNRSSANLFVLAAEPVLASATLQAAQQAQMTWQHYSWFNLVTSQQAMVAEQLVRQVSLQPVGYELPQQRLLRNVTDLLSWYTMADTLKLLLETLNAVVTDGSELGTKLLMRNSTNCSDAAAAVNRNFSVFTEFAASAAAQLNTTNLTLGMQPSSSSPTWPAQLNITTQLHSCINASCMETGASYSTETEALLPIKPGGLSGLAVKPKRLHLRVLTVIEPPFVLLENGSYTGYSVAVLQYMAKQLDFDITISQPADNSYGIKLPDGSWNGMLGSVARMEADIALGPISITSERQQVVDFTLPYYDYAGLQIVMKRAGNDAYTSMFFFFTVFDNYVWLCLIATLVATGLLVTLFDKWSPFSYQNKQNHLETGEPEGKIFTFKESMWFVLGAFTQAGESFDPRATSSRFIVAGFWIFSYILMSLYTANLAAFLTVSKLTASISTVRELAAQTNIQYSVERNTIGQNFFERMRFIESKFYDVWRDISSDTESIPTGSGSVYSVWEYPIEERYTDMYRRMLGWGLFNSTEEALQKVKTGKWAMFLETPLIKYHMSKDCDIMSTGKVLSSRPYGIALQKNSPLTAMLNVIILEMQRDRVMENLKVFWWEREKVTCPSTEMATGIQLRTLSGVFVFLGGGIAVGLVMLIAEFIVAKVWGTERFKPESLIVSHLAPRPASMRRSIQIENGEQLANKINRNATQESQLSVRSYGGDVNEAMEIGDENGHSTANGNG